MHRIFFMVVVVVTMMLVVSEAQLTFSTGWGNGKRSMRTENGDGCLTEESLYAVYKLIQREAEKFLACQTDGKN